jgi:hypothetical protein
MQKTNISSNCFIQLLYSLTMGQGPKHVGVRGFFYNIIVDLIQLWVFIGLNYRTWILRHGTAYVRMEFMSASSYAFVAWKGIDLPLPLTLGEGGWEKKNTELFSIK